MAIIDGKHIADQLLDKLATRIASLAHPPGLAAILIGDNLSSARYVKHKRRACQRVGIHFELISLSAHCTQSEVLAQIDTLNTRDDIDGILVQLPIPPSLNTSEIMMRIAVAKDVDGLHVMNVGKLTQRNPALMPCTPKGIMHLLDTHQINITGIDAVVVGASQIVGTPMALALLDRRATVTICHSKTRDLTQYLQRADLVVVAVGKAQFITGAQLKPGCTVIDVGISRLANGCLVGDVEFSTASQQAAWITPVPGGVGPMTIASLIDNTVLAYQRRHDR